ncbi:MAG: hypothetical protein OQJ99_08870 [Rhodospirillales bacterium]|nr:hypothetical protein [Rhodospirillales bacterium]MCW8862390.1 hypothetical protein [Rhodospirillales bacterium]MCW8952109.1 hypothetical protein [Rhodospirillales bacterium]MCW8971440.1 hypothetical protein [Rhodospirillales bacterium]MCW9003268.1 hypothetical protein [Rhodospirillales bacterium]
MPLRFFFFFLFVAVLGPFPLAAEQAERAAPETEGRELVKLPPPIRDYMLEAMRDHLVALNELLDALSLGDFEQAGIVAESRLGLRSPEGEDAADIRKHLPRAMIEMDMALYEASGRFVEIAQDARNLDSATALDMVFAGLRDITDACVACHSGYRLR